MALIINDMNTLFNIVIDSGEEKLSFTFRQLSYKEKNKITALTTTFNQGKAVVDTSLTCFYVLKFGLVEVDGLNNPDGTPWKLAKIEEDGFKCNADESIDALLNAQISNGLIFAANAMLNGIPNEVTHPLTGAKIQGVEVIRLPQDDKKKS